MAVLIVLTGAVTMARCGLGGGTSTRSSPMTAADDLTMAGSAVFAVSLAAFIAAKLEARRSSMDMTSICLRWYLASGALTNWETSWPFASW